MTTDMEIAAVGSKALNLCQEIADAEGVPVVDRYRELCSVRDSLMDVVDELRKALPSCTCGQKALGGPHSSECPRF